MSQGSASWQPFVPQWSSADVPVAETWNACGGQWLTDPDVGVPATLVSKVAGIIAWLDNFGAGLRDLFGNFGVGVLTERAATQALPPADRVSCGGASRFVRCADGWIAVSLARPDDFAAVPALLGVDSTELSDEETWSIVEQKLAVATVATTTERAGLLGLACAAIGDRSARGSGMQVESLGATSPKRVDQLVVANLASLWAGPLAADVLARCGARVISIESATRPDGARAWPDFFDDLHRRCEFVAFDFTDVAERERLAELLHSVDVVIEGSRPRALEQMGIDARALTRDGPRVWVSITGHGREEPNAHRIGFGDDTAAAGGLVGWVDDEPRFLADAVADPITGLGAAAAVIQLAAAGGRWLVDAPLAAVAAAHAGGFASALPEALPPRRRLSNS